MTEQGTINHALAMKELTDIGLLGSALVMLGAVMLTSGAVMGGWVLGAGLLTCSGTALAMGIIEGN